MNTNELKRFAQQARIKLIDQITAKLEQVLNTESAELIEKTEELKNLREAINKEGREQIIDKVAYTWFNRLVALRFMDANDFQPLGIRVVSPLDGETLPELLQQVRRGIIPDELPVNKQKINDLLLNRITSDHPQEEVYRMLLVGACNHLHQIFPFLFERIHDYSELLLPDDLLSQHSLLEDIRQGMSVEDCQEVEILGWLYQFYISERKDEVFAAKGKVEKEDIPAATQLFTPRWIVEYMVQNTVGKLWLQNRPNSSLKEHMTYYIDSPVAQSEDFLKIDSVEEITLLDQACGSGHILVYGFELLAKIYEEEGYSINEIPKLIIEKNLFGFEIDERASQLAGLALMMKARSYSRRAFRNPIQPNIMCYQDLALSDEEIEQSFQQVKIKISEELMHDLKNMQQATNLGSLIQPHTDNKEIKNVLEKLGQNTSSDAFLQLNIDGLIIALEQLSNLNKKYHCVVDNPPYMGGGNMNKPLSDYVRVNYPDSKADLMACFMEGGLNALLSNGLLGMINQHSWMFLSSYEKLREKLIENTQFDTLLHLGPRTFPEIGGEVVQNAAFTFINAEPKLNSSYIRLVDFDNTLLKSKKNIEAIQNPKCGWFYIKNQKDFEKIPGNNIGYWVGKSVLKTFENDSLVRELYSIQGIITGGTDRYLRVWSEISFNLLHKDEPSFSDEKYWVAYTKGGGFRKWFGNNTYTLLWKNNGRYLTRNRSTNSEFYLKPCITWNLITSSSFSARYCNEGFLWDVSGSIGFPNKIDEIYYLLGILSSKLTNFYIKFLNPTINTNIEDIDSIPVIKRNVKRINETVELLIIISKTEWNSRETSWDFLQNELIRLNKEENLSSIEEAFQSYKTYWSKQFKQLHQNEEELNKEFISIYGLEEELTPDVPLKDITILRDELKKKKLENLSDEYNSGWTLVNGDWTLENQNSYPVLPFDKREIMRQFVSYAVGCMFGRYSLDKEGLILANQGETLSDYFKKLELSETEVQFTPDDDAIIPVLDDEWFEDDIASQFRNFLRASFGRENFEQNLRFIEDGLGRNIRDYFIRDFYNDHIKRYQKRPIYWLFSSASGSFNVLVYMHRYNKDTLNLIYNNYLMDYKAKLNNAIKHQQLLQTNGTAREQTLAIKEEARISKVLVELSEYEKDLYKIIQSGGVNIDLDDGVLVNYNKFGDIIKMVRGLNDKKAKEKVRKFDWIDVEEIR